MSFWRLKGDQNRQISSLIKTPCNDHGGFIFVIASNAKQSHLSIRLIVGRRKKEMLERLIFSIIAVAVAVAWPVKVDVEPPILRIVQILCLVAGIIVGMLAFKGSWPIAAGYGIACLIVFRIFDVPRQFPKKESDKK